jgi:hypothetical protein
MSNDVATGATSTADAALIRAEDAKARRAARKAARAAIPPPERDHAYDHLGLDQLRDLRGMLGDEETRVAYWRRIITARLDSVRGGTSDREPVADLTGVLHEADHAVERLDHFDVPVISHLAPLPDLAELWSRQVDPADQLAVARLGADLESGLAALDAYRDEVALRAEAITRELIARYREQPLLALQTLPGDPLGRTVLN